MSSSKEITKETVRILVYLYSIVMGFALKTSVDLTIAPNNTVISLNNLPIRSLAIFGIFFISIIPFYHGAALFIIKTYQIYNENRKKGEALIDFFALELEAIVFYAMARSITKLDTFLMWYGLVLLLDVTWVIFTYFKSQGELMRAPLTWALLNSVMMLLLIVMSGLLKNDEVWIYLLLLAASIVRTFIDYWKDYNFYFGEEDK